MNTSVSGDHVSSDPPNEKKPPMLSWRWWALMFGALKFWKYTPKDWAIWNLSSYATYGMVFGVFKPVAAAIGTKLPWLMPAVKAAWAKTAAFVVALFHVSSP